MMDSYRTRPNGDAFPLSLSRPMTGIGAVILGTAPAWAFVAALGFAFKEQLGLSTVQIGLLTSCLSLGYVAVALPFGSRIDHSGGNWWMTRAPLVLGVCFGVSAIAGNFWTLAALAAISGALWSGTVAATNRFAAVLAPARRQGLLIGFNQTMVMASVGIAAFTLPWVATQWGWRAGLLGLGISGVVAGSVASVAFRGSHRVHQPERVESVVRPPLPMHFRMLIAYGFLTGAVMHCLWTFLLLYITSDLSGSTSFGSRSLALLFASAAVGRLLMGLALDRGVSTWILLLSSTLVGILALVGLVFVADERIAVIVLVMLLGSFLMGHNTAFIVAGLRMMPREHWAYAGGALPASHVAGGVLGPPAFALVVQYGGGYNSAWIFTVFLLMASLLPLRWAERWGGEEAKASCT